MSKQSVQPSSDALLSSWSNRILILATVGILFLTLYPFRFSFHSLPAVPWPILLGKSVKRATVIDAILNVLLFIPFGFGLAAKLKERGISIRLVAVSALACGALFSYSIELLQLYIPERDSGWEDVFTNGSGSLIGSLLYFVFGESVVRATSSAQSFLVSIINKERLTVALVVYFCAWCGFAALLQRQTRLSNWKPDALLVLGNDAAGEYPWRGEIRSLQIWDRPVTWDESERSNTASRPANARTSLPLVDYDFSVSSVSLLETKFIPNLFWIPAFPTSVAGDGLTLDGTSWAATKEPVASLIDRLRETNQFAIRITVKAAAITDNIGRILSISDSSGFANLTLRQEKSYLVFWFRTPVSMRHAQLAWSVTDGFKDHQPRDILYSYDGSNLRLTIDGKKQRITYSLGPGTGVAEIFRKVKASELEGYNYVFYVIVFGVAGAVLGLANAKNRNGLSFRASTLVFFMLLLAAIALELILVRISGKALAIDRIGLSIVLGIAGWFWARADVPTGPVQ